MPDLDLRFALTCVYCAAPGQKAIDTSALIDEDVELHGNPFAHALARAGVIDYAERAADLTPRTPSTGTSRCALF